MKLWKCILFFIVAAMVASCCRAGINRQTIMVLPNRFGNAQHSVVRMVTNSSTTGNEYIFCTGFYVSPQLIITAGHCVLDRRTRDINMHGIISFKRFNEADSYKAEIIGGHSPYDNGMPWMESDEPGDDWAVLRVTSIEAQSSHWLRIASINPEASVGARVWALGHPGGDHDIVSTGIIARLNKKTIFHTANIGHGSSGGPLINRKGDVVGINVMLTRERVVFVATRMKIVTIPESDMLR